MKASSAMRKLFCFYNYGTPITCVKQIKPGLEQIKGQRIVRGNRIERSFVFQLSIHDHPHDPLIIRPKTSVHHNHMRYQRSIIFNTFVATNHSRSMGFFNKLFGKEEKESLNEGLSKTKESFFGKLAKAVAGKSTVDADVLDSLEEVLISGDVGVTTTLKIIKRIEARVAKDKYVSTTELNTVLKDEVASLLMENNSSDTLSFEIPKLISRTGEKIPYVITVVGVNGVGKTTTIGKLSHQFKKAGYHVVLGAADTFRAAAVEQLTIWSQRTGVDIVSQGMNADPASVAFDTLSSAKAKGADVVIIDTAGRLHNKINLMNELTKIKNVMKKVIPDAPHDVLLVLDASTGQNAIEQCRQFTAATDVTALALTKLDGTAKGGVVIGISDEFKIPVKYIGVGEKMDDLQVFNRTEFVDSLFSKE